MQKEVIRKLSYCHTRLFQLFIFPCISTKLIRTFRGHRCHVEICQYSGSGVEIGRSWTTVLYYYPVIVVYVSRLDPAPDRAAPDLLSIGKLRVLFFLSISHRGRTIVERVISILYSGICICNLLRLTSAVSLEFADPTFNPCTISQYGYEPWISVSQ